jgi:hypothetical protein
MNLVRRIGQAAATTAVSLTVALTLPVTAAHAACDPNDPYPPEECKPPVTPVVEPFHVQKPPVTAVQNNEFSRPPATDNAAQLPFTGSDVVMPLAGTGAALVIAGGLTLVAVRRRRASA